MAGATGTVAAGAAEAQCMGSWCGPYLRSLGSYPQSLGMCDWHGELSPWSARFRTRLARLLLRQLPAASKKHPREDPRSP